VDKKTVKEIRSWLASGHDVLEVADFFSISETTVRKYGGRELVRKATALAKAKAEAEEMGELAELTEPWPDDKNEIAANKQFKKVDELGQLLKFLSDEKNPLLRERAALAIGRMGDRRAVMPLLDALKDPSGPQLQIVWALGKLDDERAVLPLINFLVKADQQRILYVGSEAVSALSKINSSKSLDPLLSVIKNKKNSLKLRRVSIGLVGRLADVRAVPVMIAVLKSVRHERVGIRHPFLYALGDIMDENAVDTLLDFLPVADTDFQKDILDNLPWYGSIVLEKIEQRLKVGKKDEKVVLRRARKVLQKFIGRTGVKL
jgi:HEAT repeat protein